MHISWDVLHLSIEMQVALSLDAGECRCEKMWHGIDCDAIDIIDQVYVDVVEWLPINNGPKHGNAHAPVTIKPKWF